MTLLVDVRALGQEWPRVIAVCPDCGATATYIGLGQQCYGCGVVRWVYQMRAIELSDVLLRQSWQEVYRSNDRAAVETALGCHWERVVWEPRRERAVFWLSSGQAVAVLWVHEYRAWLRSAPYSADITRLPG